MAAWLAKAAAMVLAQHPVVNTTCKDGKSFTYNSSINIAVAVAIDGTFTLSNLGMFGVDRFDAILPLGQGAITAARASKPTAIIGEVQNLLQQLVSGNNTSTVIDLCILPNLAFMF
ncbi:hypothetical protein HYC85_031639 [Camellia sinensis]|uniref:2-oxoacid dehydrogenase acyltransferase catalytic domain-containing protein n=1 Tax=Camellia sinensis TaxID=4442 RepID=A0A7J7FUQ9_CAMSI|nr:hypothetical protein HYC85_031639 [Camellia sinensis]